MSDSNSAKHRPFGKNTAFVFPNAAEMGAAASVQTAKIINQAIAEREEARIMVATGNSQDDFVAALTARDDIDWSRVTCFHMDEYIGISDDHSASFRRWLRTKVEEVVHPKAMHYLAGDAEDIDAEIHRYTELLLEGPLDAAFVGFGENGHIAFNDPPFADFNDPAMLKVVTLDEACRKQQVGEGHFPDLDAVPTQALSVTCTGLLRAKNWISCVPEKRKAEAVRKAFHDPVSTDCPATIAREHPSVYLYLDEASASLL